MENIFTAAKPFLVVSKYLGLFPMSFDGPTRKGSLKLKWTDLIYLFLAFFLFISALYFCLTSKITFYKTDSRLILETCSSLAFYSVLFDSLCLIGQFYYRENVVEFLRIIQKFDFEVRIINENK
jgi:hypothetical protein